MQTPYNHHVQALNSFRKLPSPDAITDVLTQDAWLDDQNIQQLLPVCKRTIQRWRKKGILPYVKIGGKIFYRKSIVAELLCRHQEMKREQEK